MIVQANALRLPLAAQSVHCVVTSPPYWGLRRYDGEHQEQLWPDGWRGQLGLEPTPELYLDHLAAVFGELARVLRLDGTAWVNMGDCYASKPFYDGATQDPKWRQARNRGRHSGPNRNALVGLVQKNLLGMPWRLALRLQSEGWILRSEIVWHKPTAMPESVCDRPTRAHEQVFLLARSERYYYDYLGSMEAASGGAHARGRGLHPKAVAAGSAIRRPRNPSAQTPGRIRSKQNASFSAAVVGLVSRRRMRTVWSIAGDPYRGAHYAAFPRELARRCIVAGTSERGVCPDCGAPGTRIIERQRVGDWARKQAQKANGINRCKFTARAAAPNLSANHDSTRANGADRDLIFWEPKSIGWQPGCQCGGDPIPALVLDPFGGSGTVGEVAYKLGRRAILVDLAYQEMQRERLGLFAGMAAVAG